MMSLLFLLFRSPRGVTFLEESKNLSHLALKNLVTYVKYQRTLLFLFENITSFGLDSAKNENS